jgi:very-short-patch-repair endonuclease
VSSNQTARKLRRDQTDEEKQLWRAWRDLRFAGLNLRRQDEVGICCLDFYCPDAKLDVELDGFQHGLGEGLQHDEVREKFLADQGIETLRFWNHQWRENREGCLMEAWNAVQRRTGWVRVMESKEKQRRVPPDPKQVRFLEGNGHSPRQTGRDESPREGLNLFRQPASFSSE